MVFIDAEVAGMMTTLDSVAPDFQGLKKPHGSLM